MEHRQDPNGGHHQQSRRGYDIAPLKRPRARHPTNNSNSVHNNHEDVRRRDRAESFREEKKLSPGGTEVAPDHVVHRNERSLSHPVKSDWKCIECGAWNYPDLDRCDRCGTHADDMFPVLETKDRAGDDVIDKEGYDEEMDEFGRLKKPAKKQKKQPEFPPCFDEKGSAFVFDSRSGMFYEKMSDFFYDPQSKLYYGNKQSAYFRYDGDAEKFFVQVQNFKSANNSGNGNDKGSTTVELDAILGDTSKLGKKAKASDSSKPAICINLKTKKLPGSSSTKNKLKTAESEKIMISLNPQKKQRQDDISKWSERQEELKASVPQSRAESTSTRKISHTAKGEPICTLCKRKFPNLEKFEYHERVSKLHAENLKKQNESKVKQVSKSNLEAVPDSNYVDRAQQRRDMYGSEIPLPVIDATSEPSTQVATQAAATVKPSETLGNTNVGNKMLQKLGWQSGKSLGRRGNETTPTQTHLKNDWERIEALASQRK